MRASHSPRRSRATTLLPFAAVIPLVAVSVLLAACSPPARAPEGGPEAAVREFPLDRPFPGSDFVSVDGYRIHVLRWMPPPDVSVRGRVLLVHGFAASVYGWRLLGPALAARGYLTVAADYPPFGYSTPSDAEAEGKVAGTPGSRARLLWDFLDSEDRRLGSAGNGGNSGGGDNSGDRWILIGHSLGGRITAWMAGMQPSRTARLVLVAPAIFGDASSPGLLAGPIVQGWLSANLGPMLRDGARIRSILARAYGRYPTDEETRGYWAPLLRPGEAELLLAWSRHAAEPVGPPLSAIAAPTLILWGTADQVVKPEGARLARQIPASRFVTITGGSHCLMETQFEATWAAVSEFLDRL